MNISNHVYTIVGFKTSKSEIYPYKLFLSDHINSLLVCNWSVASNGSIYGNNLQELYFGSTNCVLIAIAIRTTKNC